MAGLDWNAPLPSGGSSGDDFRSKFPEVFGGGQPAPSPRRVPDAVETARPSSETRVPLTTVEGEMPASEYANMPIGQVLGKAVTNIPSSGINVAKQLGNAVYNLPETLSSVGDVGKGLISKAAGMVGVEQDPTQKAEAERAVNAIGDMYTKRYTDYGEFAKTLAEDPFAIGMDVATVVPGIGLASKAPLAGKIANVARLGDPLALATKAISAVPRVTSTALKIPQALASGTPTAALKVAEEVGRTGGPAARQAFLNGANKNIPINTVSDVGSDMMKELKANAQKKYLDQKASLATDELPMTDIYGTLAKVEAELQSKGLFPQFRAVLAEMKDQIDDVATSPNPAHRSAVGLDALKQSLNDTIDSSRLGGKLGAAGEIARSVRDTIAKADPAYAEMMERYQEWIKHFKDLKGIGFNENLSETSRIQKLLTLLKKEDRLDLLQKLSTQTSAGKDLIPMLAGMAFRDIAPPAFQGFGLAGLGMMAAQGPHGITAAAMGSPKLAGLSQYGLGRLSNAVPQVNSAIPNALVALEDQRMGRKSGGRVDSHDVEADHLVRAAERAKKGLSAHTEGLLNTSDDAVASALEVANRSI